MRMSPGTSPSTPTALAAETPAALDPGQGQIRVSPAIGGAAVAWADYTADPAHPQIMVFDTATQTGTDLSNDLSAANLQPAVSPDGSVVVWSKCGPSGTTCQIWEGTRGSAGTWSVSQLTNPSSGIAGYDSPRQTESTSSTSPRFRPRVFWLSGTAPYSHRDRR